MLRNVPDFPDLYSESYDGEYHLYWENQGIMTLIAPPGHRRELWFSCSMFTVWIKTETDSVGREIIIDGAPIIKKFMGSNLYNLRSWALLKSGGPVTIETLKEYMPSGRAQKTLLL
jgi:hypothetical protein